MRQTLGYMLVAIALFIAGTAVGVQIAFHNMTRPPVCVVVHPNGAPAPASCSDPNAYQVAP